MPSQLADRLLWLTFGVVLFAAAKGIQYAISDIVQLTEVERPIKGGHKKTGDRQIEDSIAIETLRTLATSPNANIQNAAISLVVTRFTSLPNAVEMLVKDAQSSDDDTRRKAQTAMKFLRDWDSSSGSNTFEVPDMPTAAMPVGGGDMTEEVLRNAFPPAWSPNGPLPRRGAMDIGARVLPGLYPRPSDEIADLTVEVRGQRMEEMRRWREAMVLHEGEGEVNAGDIFPAV